MTEKKTFEMTEKKTVRNNRMKNRNDFLRSVSRVPLWLICIYLLPVATTNTIFYSLFPLYAVRYMLSSIFVISNPFLIGCLPFEALA